MAQHTQHRRPRITRIITALLITGASLLPTAQADSPSLTPVESRAALGCAPDTKLRYCDNGDGTVRDTQTGLLWLKDAACIQLGQTDDGKGTFEEANAAAASLRSGQCGLSDGSKPGDWRLPSRQEWQAMLHPSFKNPAIGNSDGARKWRPGDVFINIKSDGYWSSDADTGATGYAWGAGLFGGIVASAKEGFEGYIWPVRKP